MAKRRNPTETLSAEVAAAVTEVSRLLLREGVHVNRSALSVLATLRAGPKRITDLAAAEYLTQPGMTTLVSRLEDEGWVERRPDAGDGRVVNVAITKAGVAMLEKALAARTAVLQKRIELLGPKEKQALAAAAAALQTLTQDRPEVT